MLDVELWEIVGRAIREKREDILIHMEMGKYQEISKYREDVGFLCGLKFVEDAVRDVYNPKREEYDN